MTADPYQIVADAFCPHCGVKGRMVAETSTVYFYDDSADNELRTCVECGGLHVVDIDPEARAASVDWLKDARIQFGRLIEGRPYEPPPPPPVDPNRKSLDEVLKRYYATVTCTSPGYNAVVDLNKTPWTWNGVPIVEDKNVPSATLGYTISGIAEWLPAKSHPVGCGWPGAGCDCEKDIALDKDGNVTSTSVLTLKNPADVDRFNFHGPVKVPLPAEWEDRIVDGAMQRALRVTAVDPVSGTITVESVEDE